MAVDKQGVACESKLGAMIESRVGSLSCPERVLVFWEFDRSPLDIGDNPERLAEFYSSRDVIVDVYPEWTGNEDDYRLVIAKIGGARQFPSFVNGRFADGWRGRIHYTGGHEQLTTIIDDANQITERTGLAIVPAILQGTPGRRSGPTTNTGLMLDQPEMPYALTSQVSGGRILAWHTDVVSGGLPWFNANVVGTVEWVLSGSSIHLFDTKTGPTSGVDWVGLSAAFLNNLYDVTLSDTD